MKLDIIEIIDYEKEAFPKWLTENFRRITKKTRAKIHYRGIFKNIKSISHSYPSSTENKTKLYFSQLKSVAPNRQWWTDNKADLPPPFFSTLNSKKEKITMSKTHDT